MHAIQGSVMIAGIDEAGRGPLAGPVIAAAVILNPQQKIKGLRDSKKLTEKQRETLFSFIQGSALSWAIGRAEVEEIDKINILQATLLAMQRAVLNLNIAPELALVDGNQTPALSCRTIAIVKGDEKEPAISAASIIAKVTRDHEMLILDQQFPEYGFAQHKGYATEYHLAMLTQYGPCVMHRKSFAPIARSLSDFDLHR